MGWPWVACVTPMWLVFLCGLHSAHGPGFPLRTARPTGPDDATQPSPQPGAPPFLMLAQHPKPQTTVTMRPVFPAACSGPGLLALPIIWRPHVCSVYQCFHTCSVQGHWLLLDNDCLLASPLHPLPLGIVSQCNHNLKHHHRI